MSASEQECRWIGAAAAVGGLVVMMCSVKPSMMSMGCGLAGLAVFGASRMMLPRRPVATLEPAPVPQPPVAPPTPSEALEAIFQRHRGALADPNRARSQPVYLSKVSLGRMPRSAPLPSSVLPPSRAARTPKASEARTGPVR